MTGTVTDMVSFYTLPSTALNHPVHKDLKAACVLYCISKATPLLQLMEDTLIICKAVSQRAYQHNTAEYIDYALYEDICCPSVTTKLP